MAELRSYFSPDLQARIVGVTPTIEEPEDGAWIPQGAMRYLREWECRKWMRQNCAPGTPWVALDDMAEWFQPGCVQLVKTDSLLGFQAAQAFELRDLIMRLTHG